MPRFKWKFQDALSKPTPCVMYLRMSSSMQNSRSPAQQEEEIRQKIRQLNLPWTVVKIYTDSAISGRTHDRPAFKQMMADLKSGRVRANLILVDTFERFSRSEDSGSLRIDLRKRGILVVTANTGFADPTSSMGQLQSAFESIRAADNNSVKAHDVRRGKKDCVRQGYWPGGPPPLGFKLELVFAEKRQDRTVYHQRLVEDEKTSWIIRDIFRLGGEYGWGGIRIIEFLNRDDRLSSCGVILQLATVDRILRNPIYIGHMAYGKQTREADGDILYLDDTDPSEWEVNESFCQGIVDRDVWNRVQAMIERRKRPGASEEDEVAPQMSGPGSGVALKYPLSGLVVCPECGRAMVPSSTQPYETASGEIHEYVYYVCPITRSGLCDNRTTISEPRLREQVMSLVVERCFIGNLAEDSDADNSQRVSQIMRNPEFSSFVESVSQRLLENQPDGDATRQALIRRRDELERNCDGWLMTLGDQTIGHALRTSVQMRFDRASSEMDQINATLSSEQIELGELQLLASPLNVATRLAQLSQIIASDHATVMNLALAEHIDEIRCYPDRTVTVRFCHLGALTDSAGLASIPSLCSASDRSESASIRRKTRRNLSSVIEDDTLIPNDTLDPRRFMSLQEHWFEEVTFTIPERLHWYQEHACAVAEYRYGTLASIASTAEHFGVTTPTISKALKYAHEKFGYELPDPALRYQNRMYWSRRHAAEVAAFMAQPGSTLGSASQHFGKTEETINRALMIAQSAASPVRVGAPAQVEPIDESAA